MRYRITKLFKGYATIRDQVIKTSIETNEPLEVWFGTSKMTLPVDVLKNKLITEKRLKNMFLKTQLFEFKFEPDIITRRI